MRLQMEVIPGVRVRMPPITMEEAEPQGPFARQNVAFAEPEQFALSHHGEVPVFAGRRRPNAQELCTDPPEARIQSAQDHTPDSQIF
ncbi:hypothetical protein G7Z17_g2950 [Cylindrodendrum hubeiense]|uniref:Uncharacterized protein n=1 Tax=Cylindrodendrum hubeiense TaxID=595255 RepID=A0A9P5HM39_9HYPO|nr:hypothetical protein G7Z17_g2950 [Cylindrodendrum hubeiense]